MALKDFHREHREVNFPGGSVKLHGVSFDTLAQLVSEARDDVATAIDAYGEASEAGQTGVEAIALLLLERTPGRAAKLIALAAEEPDAEAHVRKMPFPVQTDMLAAVADLTFTEADALKKFLAHLTRATSGMGQAQTIPQIGPAGGGSTASGGKSPS